MAGYFHIRCVIERGGFSSERTFEITLPDDGKLVGTADVDYLCDEAKIKLGDDEPRFGERMQGYVKCRLLRKSGSKALVDLPSTDVVYVAENELLIIPA